MSDNRAVVPSGTVTPDVSSPAYFERTYGVSAAQAADLSRQATFATAHRGGGITAEVPQSIAPSGGSYGAPVATPQVQAPDGSATVLTARAEYDQLMADRASGKLNSAQWNSGGAARERALAEIIANGAGDRPAAAAAAPLTQSHPYLGAPASPMDYGFLRNAGELPDEQVQRITEQQAAFARLNLSRAVVQDVHDRLRTNVAELERLPAEQQNERIAANYARFTAMCAREGLDGSEAQELVGRQLRAWSAAEPALRPILEGIANIGDPTTLDYILQIAKHNRARGR